MSLWRKNRARRVTVTAAALGIAAALAYKVYRAVTDEKDINRDKDAFPIGRFSASFINKNVTIAVSRTVIASLIDLIEVLEANPNITFVVVPNIDWNNIDSRNALLVDGSISNYKLLACLNMKGFTLIIKSLQADILLICGDDIGRVKSDINSELGPFVPRISHFALTDEFDSHMIGLFN